MSKVTTESSNYTNIANAIRQKNGLTTKYKPSEMAEAIKILPVGGDTYTGEYIVRPAVTAQTLETKGKTMKDNVTIKRIPRYEVSNTSGGTTFTIGGENGD